MFLPIWFFFARKPKIYVLNIQEHASVYVMSPPTEAHVMGFFPFFFYFSETGSHIAQVVSISAVEDDLEFLILVPPSTP